MTEIAERIDDPLLCIVRTGQGQRVTGLLAELLNPVDPKTFHQYRLPARTDVELHYHDFDEYWWFVSGHARVTLRSPHGMLRVMDLEPGDLVCCVRGVEHTLWSAEELVYYQYSSVLLGTERNGHLVKTP